MANVIEPITSVWTASDLAARFGPIPLDRVRLGPLAGSATERDVVEIHDREGRLYELIDGVLVEKTVGTFESYLAIVLARRLGDFVALHDLGIVLGADGMMRLAPGLVCIPDLSFISWQRLPGRRIPEHAIAEVVPDLAVEIISRGNTREEMDRKLDDYFGANVRQVWYFYPGTKQVHVFIARDRCQILQEADGLDGGDVVPGFQLPLSSFFARP